MVENCDASHGVSKASAEARIDSLNKRGTDMMEEVEMGPVKIRRDFEVFHESRL